MPDEHGTVRAIAWRELFPWLQLATALRFAMRIRMLLVAAVALLLTIGGWWVLAKVFSGTSDPVFQSWLARDAYRNCPWAKPSDAGNPVPPLDPWDMDNHLFDPPGLGRFWQPPFYAGWWELSAPFRQIFSMETTYTSLAFLLLAALWAVIVWALFGGLLTRMAALKLTREENIGWKPAMAHARSKWLSYFSAPLLPLLGILLITIPTALVGLLLHFAFGKLVFAILMPLLLIGGLLMTIFLIGLFFGWPLMWAAVSTEASDAFDAISRAYSYVYQRPWHYLFYAIVAALLGVVGGTLVYFFAGAVIYLTSWAASWGGVSVFEAGNETSGVGVWGLNLMWFWQGLVRLIAIAFAYSYFWSATTSIYLLLRFQVDGTEMDEVYVDDAPESLGVASPEAETTAATPPATENPPPATA